MTGLTCENCRFFAGGYCHRYPPVVVQIGSGTVSQFPEVASGECSCGEFVGFPCDGGPAGELRGTHKGGTRGARIVGGAVDILSLPVEGGDVKGAETVRDYLRLILRELWLAGNAFSTKRPLGNFDWWNPVYRAMIVAGIAEGSITDDGGVVDIDIRATDRRITKAIMGM